MRFLSRIGPLLFWVVIVAALFLVLAQGPVMRTGMALLDPSSEAAFEEWLAEDEERARTFAAFEAFLREEGVADIVPAWQFARIDSFYAQRCDAEIWILPPREVWPNIVPALKLVREHVETAVGEVAVQSSYRSPELNVCAGGASRSRHLRFEAVDLRLVNPRRDLEGLYRDLCAMHERVGPASQMGLGAYYDFSDDGFNRGGRFHIDAAGYRTWGRTYASGSSPCGRFD